MSRFVLINAGLYQELFTSDPMTAEVVVQKARTISAISPSIFQAIQDWVSDPNGGTLLRVRPDVVLARLQEGDNT